jgi:hypothetical protein
VSEDLRLAAQRRAIEAARRLFEETGNALFAWEAYGRSRTAGLEIPEWVLTYFDQTARRLNAMSEQAAAGKLNGDPQRGIVRAFGMETRGAASIFARFYDRWLGDWDWLALGSEVAAYVRAGDKETFAITNVYKDLRHADEEAERRGLVRAASVPSESAIWRAWNRYKKELPSSFRKTPIS